MAGFTVPNASEYGTTIQSLDQAEPDSLDFKILGNHNYGVLSGADITVYSADNGSAALTASYVYVNNYYGYVSASTVVFDAPEADARFDILVVTRIDSTTFQYGVVKGTTSSTNPIFPTLSDSQLPLYAIYRKSGVTLNTLSVVDKRMFLNMAHRTGTAIPSEAADQGDLYIRTGTAPATEQSSLYVYVDSAWQNLAKYEGVREDPLHPFLFVGI
jgi:predicted Zn-dependent protease